MSKENKSSPWEIILAVISTVFIIAVFGVAVAEVYNSYNAATVEEQQGSQTLTAVEDEEKRLVAAIETECKKSAYKYSISSSFKEIEYSKSNPRDEDDPVYRLIISVMLPNLQQVKDTKKYYDFIKQLKDIAESDLDYVDVYFTTNVLNDFDIPVPISAIEDKYGLMYICTSAATLCYIGKKENGVIKPLSEIMPYVGMREGAINLTKLGTANTVKDETKSKLNSKYYYWHTKDAGGPSLTFRYYAEVTVRNGTVQNVSLKPENKNFKYSDVYSSSSSSGSSYYYKPSKKDEETTTKKFSNPYNVQDFGDPEDFYDYWYDDFEDYEEAYDYYYDHYPY